METNLLNGRTFQNMDDLRECARWWIREKSDTHIHDTTGRPPVELFFEEEHDALHPLPVHPYDCGEVALRVCNLDGHIEHETNHYPVPYEHIADILTVKATEDEILIYSPELDLIVRHQRWPNGSKHKLDSTNIHGAKTLRYGLEPVRDQFIELGESAEEFLHGLQSMKVKNAGFHVRSILQLKRRYHCDDIHRALDHACRYFAYDSKSVERILMMKAQPRTLESIRNENASEQLRASLPEIIQRPLEEYRVLFNPCETSEEITDGNSQRQDQDIS